MKLEIKTEVKINATPKEVWAIITQFDKYPKWNPFIKSVEGLVKVGEFITVSIEPSGSNAMTFKPKVLTFVENKEFSWLGHLLFPGIFDGNHKFELIDNRDGTTCFIQSEKFSGIMVRLFKNNLNKNTKEGFIMMNKKLKELVETNINN